MESQRNSNNNTQAIQHGPPILQLRDLYPSLKNCTIQGRVVIKGDRHNSGGQYVINLEIADKFSEMKVVLKGKAPARFENMLAQGSMYQFESGSVCAARDGSTYVKLGNQARIIPLPNNPAVPAMHFNPIENIACLSKINAKAYIGILGIVVNKQLTTKATKRGEGIRLVLTIADTTGQLRVTAWDEQASACYKKLEQFPDPIVMGWKYVRVSESSSEIGGRKKILHAFRDTSIALYENDLLDLAVDVKGFKQMWINHQANNGQQHQRYGTTTTTSTTTRDAALYNKKKPLHSQQHPQQDLLQDEDESDEVTTATTTTTTRDEALCNKKKPLHSQQQAQQPQQQQQLLPQDEDESDEVTTITTTTTTTTTKKTTKIKHPKKKPRREIISLESSSSSSSSEEKEFDYKPEYCNKKDYNGKRKRC